MPLSVTTSADAQTVKYVLPTDDGYGVEITYVNRDSKHIVCFSTQIGCVVGCAFCISGAAGRRQRSVRSLTANEIIDQVEFVVADLKLSTSKPILFSAMGEGEPLLAYRSVVDALMALSRRKGARIALSTSGAKPRRIRELAHECWLKPLKLQISIHAASDAKRKSLIPLSPPIAEIAEAAEYFAQTTRFPVELNYVLLDGVNDSREDALALAQIALPREWLVKLNRFNKSDCVPFSGTPPERTSLFAQVLRSAGALVEGYETNGSDIFAACGQLSYKVLRQTSADFSVKDLTKL